MNIRCLTIHWRSEQYILCIFFDIVYLHDWNCTNPTTSCCMKQNIHLYKRVKQRRSNAALLHDWNITRSGCCCCCWCSCGNCSSLSPRLRVCLCVCLCHLLPCAWSIASVSGTWVVTTWTTLIRVLHQGWMTSQTGASVLLSEMKLVLPWVVTTSSSRQSYVQSHWTMCSALRRASRPSTTLHASFSSSSSRYCSSGNNPRAASVTSSTWRRLSSWYRKWRGRPEAVATRRQDGGGYFRRRRRRACRWRGSVR